MSESSFEAEESSDPSQSSPSQGSPVDRKHVRTSNPSVERSRSRSESVAQPLQLNGKSLSRLKTALIQAEYQAELNTVIHDASHLTENDAALPGSQVGASYWTSREKEIFFAKLSSVGPYEIADLSKAIGTKSPPEIQVYLMLLQDGLLEATALGLRMDESVMEDIPAAWDVSESCERALEFAADVLAQNSEREERKAAVTKYGAAGVVHGPLAEQLELYYDQTARPVGLKDEPDPDVAEVSHDDERHSPQSQSDVSLDSAWTSGIASASLLRPATLLRLADTLFMNGPPGSGDNWIDVETSNDSTRGPAIAREALDDLYSVTLSLTKRIIQASIYQALTRIRAKDLKATVRPDQVVKADDVRIACDLLGCQRNSFLYWARAPRRAKVDVYSEASKYRQPGRPTMKTGVLLTYEEVEAALGLVDPSFVTGTDEHSADGHGSFSCVGSEDEDDTLSQDSRFLDETDQNSHKTDVTHDEYLESQDRAASQREERRLWVDVLKQQPVNGEETRPEPKLEGARRKRPLTETSWGSSLRTTEYMAEWERFEHAVRTEEFSAVETSMRRGKKRRSTMRAITTNETHSSPGELRDEESDSVSVSTDSSSSSR